jgi:RNA polymerase sigma factor (sigma-70 family)
MTEKIQSPASVSVSSAAVSDGELLRTFCATRSADAFGELVRRHRAMVHRTCLRYLTNPQDAEDASQAVFLVLAHRPTMVNRNLAGWLHKVARDTALNLLQARQRRLRREQTASRPETMPSPAEQRHIREEVDLALDRLPAALKEAVVLRYLEGRSLGEAATLAGCSERSLTRYASEGLERLRTILVRRGTVVTPAVLTALFAAEAASAVPAWTTAQLSLGAAALSQSPAGALAQGVIKSLIWAKIKLYGMVAAATLAVGTAATAPLLTQPSVRAVERTALAGHGGQVFGAAFSPNGKVLVSGAKDQSLIFWDVASAKALATFQEPDRPYFFAFSPDGKTVAVTYGAVQTPGAMPVKLWDVETKQVRRVLAGAGGNSYGVAFSPDGKRLAAIHGYNTVRIWDAVSGEEQITQSVPGAYYPAFSPDGRTLAIGTGDWNAPAANGVQLWDLSAGQFRLRTTLPGHPRGVHSVEFSPDGRLLASTHGYVVKLWDAATGAERGEMKGHTLPVVAVTFLKGGTILASAAVEYNAQRTEFAWEPAEVKLWDTASRRELATLQGSSGQGHPLAASTDGRMLVTGSYKPQPLLWNISRGR